jgi:hypothetical protein
MPVIAVYVTDDLDRRATRVAKEMRTSKAQMGRDGIRGIVETFETKIAAEQKRREEEQLRKKSRATRDPRAVTTHLPSLLEVRHGRTTSNTSSGDEELPSRKRLRSIVTDFAQRIALADDKGDEIRRLVQAAQRKAKKDLPLTHPTDDEMVSLLEAEMKRLRDEGPVEVRGFDAIGEEKP